MYVMRAGEIAIEARANELRRLYAKQHEECEALGRAHYLAGLQMDATQAPEHMEYIRFQSWASAYERGWWKAYHADTRRSECESADQLLLPLDENHHAQHAQNKETVL